MQRIKQLWFPFLIILIPGLILSLSLPYFPVDETRYLSVAWEMNLHNSFIVPLQNALPYSHKPPMLFWLINLDWFLLGVNEATLRFIPLLFSLFNIALVHRIALLLWDDEKIARYAAIILSSTLSYLLWSGLIMFDVILTFWVLLAMLGLLSASRKQNIKSWLAVGVSIGGGMLTKGPVVLVYILPVAIFAFSWVPKQKFSRRWYGWLTLALLVGIAVVLSWAIPAAMTGGETYKQAILWGQTVNRVADSFAHKRPVWWYLPWLPALLLPWALLTPIWRGSLGLKSEAGSRFALIWAVSTVAIFSFISGKQVHYLIPALPAFSLLMAKKIVSSDTTDRSAAWRYAVPAFYGALGIAACALPFVKPGAIPQYMDPSGLKALSFGLIAIGVVLFFLRQRSTPTLINWTALSSVALAAVVFSTGGAFFDRYDLHRIANAVNVKQGEGYSVLHLGKYHGQYQFIGRLKQPLVALESLEAISDYAAKHEKVALITYEAQTAAVSKEDVYLQQPFRSKEVVLWNKGGIANYIRLHDGKSAGATDADPPPDRRPPSR